MMPSVQSPSGASAPPGSWIAYWNGDPPIYVSARHKHLHGQRIAADIIAAIERPDASVLDFGCGEALGAACVAKVCGTLVLVDAAPALRAQLARRMIDNPKVVVLAPEALNGLEKPGFDLIIVNSVLQYLDETARDALLRQLAALLKPTGRLILADIVPPDLHALGDALALLRFAWQGGFLISALMGLFRTLFSGYRRLRHDLGFATYSEAQMLNLLSKAGLQARRRYPNFGHNQQRMAFEAWVTPPSRRS